MSSASSSSSSSSTSKITDSTKTEIIGTSQIDDATQLVQDMLTRIRSINRMPKDVRSSLLDFVVDGQKLGLVRPQIAERLCNIPHDTISGHDNIDHDGGSVFVIETDDMQRQYLTLNHKYAGSTVESRTTAVATVTSKLKEEGFITGWRDELFRVSETYYKDPVFLIERSACNILGVLDYGVHLNGLVKQQDSTSTSEEEEEEEPKMWIGRRSKSKSKFPGMLDHLVAGGLPADLSLMENVIKECEEEAGIPADIVKANVHPVGAISYLNWDSKTDKISRVVLFNFDLYLPPDFTPKPVDGEVEEFFLWSIDEVKESMKLDYPDPIKPNCYAVIIDYLIRQGYINPEIDGYLDILKELRSGDCQ